MTTLKQVIDHNNISQILKPRTIQSITIKDIIYYINNTEKLLDKINLKPHVYFFDDLSNIEKDICVISHNDVTGKVMLRLLRYVMIPEISFHTDKKKFDHDIKNTDTVLNIENFINYLSLMENCDKFDLYDSYFDGENRINISDVNIWTLKRLSDVLIQ